MTDDRRLEEQLRRYESRVPVPDNVPEHDVAHRRRWLVLGGLAAVGAGALLAAVVLQRPDDSIGRTSPTPSPTIAETPRPTMAQPSSSSPAPTPPASTTPAPSPTSVATPSPTGGGVPSSWTATASISDPGHAIVVNDMTTWNGSLVAVGTRYGADQLHPFGPPPDPVGMIWSSSDGRNWEAAGPAAMAGAELDHVEVTGDGSLLVIGSTWSDGVAPEYRAWTSVDGASWRTAGLDSVPSSDVVLGLARGAAGYLLATSDNGGARSTLWHSTDGLAWQPTYTASHEGDTWEEVSRIDAGVEGFVAQITRGDDDGSQASVIASSDGVTWYEGNHRSPNHFTIVPVGPDWLLVNGYSEDDLDWQDGLTVALRFSHNGLDWRSHGEATFGAFSPDAATSCAEYVDAADVAGNALFLGTVLTYGCSEGGFRTAGGTWMSVDSISWVRLPFGTHATIGGAERIADQFVVATHAGTGMAGDAGVTFWISEDR